MFAISNGSQVAVDQIAPNGRVVSVDILPMDPLKGVSAIQGDLLSQRVQDDVKRILRSFQNASEPKHDVCSKANLGQGARVHALCQKQDGMPNACFKSTSGTDLLAVPHPRSRQLQSVDERITDVVLSDMSVFSS